MSKTNRPISVLLDKALLPFPAVQDLIEKQNDVVVIEEGESYEVGRFDLILAPNAWQMRPTLAKYLDIAVKQARKQKYAKGKK